MFRNDWGLPREEDGTEGGEPKVSAKDRKEVREEAVAEGKKRYRLYKNSAASKWLRAVSRSGLLVDARTGKPNTFVYNDFTHPWAKIPPPHEVRYTGLTALCHKCGQYQCQNVHHDKNSAAASTKTYSA